MFLNAAGGIASPTALYVIAGGGNDARDALQAAAANPANASAIIGAAAGAYAQSMGTLVDQLQAAGGVDIVVWNVPNLGLAPAVTTLGATAGFLGSQVASAMNAALTSRMATESDVLLFDIFGLQSSFGAGFANVTDACGAVPIADHEYRPPDELAALADTLGFEASAHASLLEALGAVRLPARVLIFGSLYLAGEALAANNQAPG
jgi:outer membrane lipase/esterase